MDDAGEDANRDGDEDKDDIKMETPMVMTLENEDLDPWMKIKMMLVTLQMKIKYDDDDDDDDAFVVRWRFALRLSCHQCGSRSGRRVCGTGYLAFPSLRDEPRWSAQEWKARLRVEAQECCSQQGEEDHNCLEVEVKHSTRKCVDSVGWTVPRSPGRVFEAVGQRPLPRDRTLLHQRSAAQACEPEVLHCHQHQGRPWWCGLLVHRGLVLRPRGGERRETIERHTFADAAKQGGGTPDEKKTKQKAVDAAIVKSVQKDAVLKAYLKAKFALSNASKPHVMVF